ncbi:unnamed protein product [Camellia sinensis]
MSVLDHFPLMSKANSQEVITCKAVVCWAAGEAVKVEEIHVDPPKSYEVRFKMLCASLCHTDILCCNGFPDPLFPRVLGHEGVGKVKGDMVVPTFVAECGKCKNCRSGKTNLCLTYPLSASFTGLFPDGSSRMSTNGGQRLYHFLSCSTWSEYTVINIHYIVKIGPRIALPHASFISCSFSTGFGAAWKEAKVEKGSTVAVLGLGAVGLGVIAGAQTQGAGKIIGVDTNKKKREKGVAFGMTDFINPNQGVGIAILLGAGTHKSAEINFMPLLSGRAMKYSVFGGIKVQSDLPVIVDKCINKEIDNMDELLTHEVQLEDISSVFEVLKKPDG